MARRPKTPDGSRSDSTKVSRPKESRDGSPDPSRPLERSEDFAGRRDIETADEPIEEHDRRHHGAGRSGSDVESTQPG